MSDEQYCPWCEEFTYQVVIQYEPEPNTSQLESEDIPTDDLQLVAGNLCCACGDLITAHIAEATQTVDSEDTA